MKKKKISKRILSVLLAALMVITSIPLMAFSASADDALDSLTAAMSNYETAMTTVSNATDKVYTKLSDAYEAYVAAQKQYDSLKYGGVDNGASAAATTLNSAVETMLASAVSFDEYKGSAVPTFADTSGTYSVDSYYYSNLLYSPTGTESNRPMENNEYDSRTISMYYAPTVMLYDGVNETSIPVILNYERVKYFTGSNWAGIYACYPSSVEKADGEYENDMEESNAAMTPSSIFVLGGANGISYSHRNWKAWHPSSSVGVDFAACVSATSDLFYPMGTNNGNVYTETEMIKLITGSRYIWGMAINKIKYEGDSELTSTTKSYQPAWTTVHTYNGSQIFRQVHYGTANNCYLTVVDYSEVRSALTSFGSTIAKYTLSDYSEGGLSDLFAAMDAISAVKPMDYFKNSTDGTSNLAAAINTLESNQIPKLTAAYTEDSEDYQTLRDTFDGDNGIVSTYNAGNDDGVWTEDSWANFTAKYEAAQAVMASVVEKDYTDYPKQASDELIAAKAALETVAVKVDTTELEAKIDELMGLATDLIFTTETVNAAKTVIDAAKTEIWGSTDNYKNDSAKLDDSTEAQAKVAEQIALLEEAMKALRFSTTCEVATDTGTASLQGLFDEYPSLKQDEKDYVGFTEYEAMYNECLTYAETLKTQEMTDFDTLYEVYVTYVTAFLEVRQDLHITFLKADDGTFVKEANLSSLQKASFQGKGQSDIFFAGSIQYPREAVLFKTTHDAADLKYGESVMTWETLQNDHYQVLDSITFHDDTVLPEGYDNSEFFNEFHSATWFGIEYGESAIPDSLSDRYTTGDLTGENAEMTNIKVISRRNVPIGTPYGQIGEGSSTSYINEPDSSKLTEVLATTDANVEDEHCSGLVTMSTSMDEEYRGVVTFTGDMIAHVPATTECTTFEDLPEPTHEDSINVDADSYGVYGNIGFLYKWKTYGTMNSIIMGYSYLKLSDIASSCYVVDISYLIDLIDMVADTPETPYTEESYAAFREELDTAKSDYKYTEVVEGAASVKIGAANVAVAMKNRYEDLYDAYAALELKTLDVSFTCKDENGQDKTSVVKVTYGTKLSEYEEEIAAIAHPSYQANGYEYTFSGWDNLPVLNTTITSNISYTATYTATELPADWTNYDAAREELLSSLATKTYTVKDLEAVQAAIDNAVYFDPSTHTSDIMSSSQTTIDAEAATLRAAIPTAPDVDISTAKAIEEAKSTTDKDQYDVSVLDAFSLYQDVTVNGEVYEGLLFSTQAELDQAVENVLNTLNASAMKYDIYLNGEKVNTEGVDFGTPVIVNGDGSIEVNAPDLDKDADTEYLAWYYSHSAPSTNSSQTTEKYMTTSPSLGFIVKGNTYLTTRPVTQSDDGYAVTFVRGTDNKVFDIIYTDADGNFTVPSAPKLAYYSFSSYSIKNADAEEITAGETYQVSADTTIVANYAPLTEDKYTVNVMTWEYGLDTSDPEQMVFTDEYSYNEKVSITSTADWVGEYIEDDIYVWCEMLSFDPDEYTGVFVPVYYGSDYSFYACKDVDLVAFTKDEFEKIYADVEHWDYFDTILTIGTSGELYGVNAEDNFVKVLDEDGNLSKVSMIGTFILPEGYTMVETGMLLGPTGSSLQLENTGIDGVKRAKSTKFTPGNQFVLSLKVNDTNLGSTYDYAAYAVVELPDGTRTTFYSSTKTDTAVK